MGRTLTEARIIVKLTEGIEKCENQKKELLNYIHKIKDKCLDHEITYPQYEALLNKKTDDKTIEQGTINYEKPEGFTADGNPVSEKILSSIWRYNAARSRKNRQYIRERKGDSKYS